VSNDLSDSVETQRLLTRIRSGERAAFARADQLLSVVLLVAERYVRIGDGTQSSSISRRLRCCKTL